MAAPAGTGSTKNQLLDIGERTIVTAAEALGALYLTKGALSISGAEIAALTALAGGLAAVRVVVANLLASQKGPQLWLEDSFSRAIFTFAQTLVSALIVSAASNLDLSSVKAAAIAATAAALAAIKAALAKGVMSDPVFSPASLLPGGSGGGGAAGIGHGGEVTEPVQQRVAQTAV